MVNNNNITLGLILGSGIELNNSEFPREEILFEDNSGIHNKLIYTARSGGKKILVFKGRKHFYEGYGIEEITSNVNFALENGVKNLLITNAAGGLNENFSEGDLMLITSHINFISKLKQVSKGRYYSKQLAKCFRKCCISSGIKLYEGTYGCYTGPTYETRAEVRFQKKILLDAAGMSTIPEVLHGSNNGINILALSVITNLLKENHMQHTSHDEVLKTAKTASDNLNKVLPYFISELN